MVCPGDLQLMFTGWWGGRQGVWYAGQWWKVSCILHNRHENWVIPPMGPEEKAAHCCLGEEQYYLKNHPRRLFAVILKSQGISNWKRPMRITEESDLLLWAICFSEVKLLWETHCLFWVLWSWIFKCLVRKGHLICLKWLFSCLLPNTETLLALWGRRNGPLLQSQSQSWTSSWKATGAWRILPHLVSVAVRRSRRCCLCAPLVQVACHPHR